MSLYPLTYRIGLPGIDVTPMVQDAKAVAGNIRDQGAINKWRDSNQKLLDSVGQVRKAVAGPEPPPDMSGLNLSKAITPFLFFIRFFTID